jgi:hypothetical protein
LDAECKGFERELTIFDKEHHLDFIKILEIEHDDNLKLRVNFEKGEGEKENIVNY